MLIWSFSVAGRSALRGARHEHGQERPARRRARGALAARERRGARDGDVDARRDAVARANAPRHGDGAIDAYCGGGAARQEGCPNHLSESLSFERLHGAWMLPLRASAPFSRKF